MTIMTDRGLQDRMVEFPGDLPFVRSTLSGTEYELILDRSFRVGTYSHAFLQVGGKEVKLRSWDSSSLEAFANEVLAVGFDEELSLEAGNLMTGSYEVLNEETGFLLGRPTVAFWKGHSLGLWAEVEFESQKWLAQAVADLSPREHEGAAVVDREARNRLSSHGDDLLVTIPGLGILELKPIESFALPNESGASVLAGQAYHVPTGDDGGRLVIVTESAVVEVDDEFDGPLDIAADTVLSSIVSIKRIA